MIRLRTIGECTIQVGGSTIGPQSEVMFALLLYLSSSRGMRLSRGELLSLLWPHCEIDSARHRLRQALYQLRRFGSRLDTTANEVCLHAEAVWIDHAQPPASRRDLVQGLAGSVSVDFLPGYSPMVSEPFSRWFERQRDSVRSILRQDLELLLVDQRTRSEPTLQLNIARSFLELDPLNRDATLALAEAHAALGNGAEAVAVLDRYQSEIRTLSPESLRAAVELRRRIVTANRLTGDGPSVAELVGRAETLRHVEQWVARSVGASAVLALCGDAGIGKTRLLREAIRLATVRGIRSINYRPSANGEERPLAGVFDLLPRLLKLPGAVGCSPESYARLCGLAEGSQSEITPPTDRTDSVFRYATLRRSVLDLVDAIASEAELLLALDDVHWLDSESLEILLDAAHDSGNRLSVLLALRPSSAAAILGARPGVTIIRIPKLDATSARRIVARDLEPATAEARSRIIDWAVDLADGNPFFLVELAAHCSGSNPSQTLPQSLQLAIQGKLSALSETARLMVQACAVLAQCSNMERVEAVLVLPPHEVARGLYELESWALVDSRDGRLGCKHDLIADQVTRELSPALAAYLHRRCALVLDREIRSVPGSTLVWECARHWEAAGDPDRAFSLTMAIADQLLALGLSRAAADLCVRADEYSTTATQRAERLLRLRHARRLLCDWDGVIDTIRQRAVLLTAGQPRLRRYSDDEIALFEARWYRDYDGRILNPALKRLRDVEAPSLHRLQMAVIALIVADNDQRLREAKEIAAVVESIVPVSPAEDIESAKARLIYHTAFGELGIAVAAADRVVQSLRLRRSSADLLRSLRWASVPLKHANRLSDASAALTEAYEHATRLGLQTEMWHNAEALVDLYLDCENVDLAAKWGARCVAMAANPTAATATGLGLANFSYLQARIALMQGDIPRARNLMGDSRAYQASQPHTRARESVVALDVLLTLRAGAETIPPRLIARLRRLHLRSRASGIRDFETGTLLQGLLTIGHGEDARELCQEYQQHRRCQLPKHSVLRQAEAAITRGSGI